MIFTRELMRNNQKYRNKIKKKKKESFYVFLFIFSSCVVVNMCNTTTIRTYINNNKKKYKKHINIWLDLNFYFIFKIILNVKKMCIDFSYISFKYLNWFFFFLFDTYFLNTSITFLFFVHKTNYVNFVCSVFIMTTIYSLKINKHY